MAVDMQVNIAGTVWKNPVSPASGCFGVGREFVDFYGINQLGAVFSKGVSSAPWPGNQTPRVAEASNGMLNAIGLQNSGVDSFIDYEIDWFRTNTSNLPLYVNVCGHSPSEYAQVVEKLDEIDTVTGFEINVSCPNVGESCIAIGSDVKQLSNLTVLLRRLTKKALIIKLSPNVTDIALLAQTAETAGADAISAINTVKGLAIDINTCKSKLANGTGGLSGAAIHPIAVRAVAEIYQAVKMPIIGVGGITDWQSAVELMLAGASAVSIGTQNLLTPSIAMPSVIEGIEQYCIDKGIKHLKELKELYYE